MQVLFSMPNFNLMVTIGAWTGNKSVFCILPNMQAGGARIEPPIFRCPRFGVKGKESGTSVLYLHY